MAAYKDLVGQKITKVTSNPPEPKTGQMWYNSTDGALRGLGITTAWVTGGTYLDKIFGVALGGPVDAAIGAGGYGPPGPSSQNAAAEYDGSGWTSISNINTARGAVGSSKQGSQTAFWIAGGTSQTGKTEEWNGSSWTENGDLNTGRRLSGTAGSLTAGLAFGGYASPAGTANSEEYNGTSWSEGNNLGASLYFNTGFGSQTAAISACGNTGSPDQGVNNSYQYDGTSWTSLPNVSYSQQQGGSHGNTSEGFVYGGSGTPSTYVNTTSEWSGTAWSTIPQTLPSPARAWNGTGATTSGLQLGGSSPALPGGTTNTNEFTRSTNTITTAAWSSGGSLNTGRRDLGGFGTKTAGAAISGDLDPGYAGNVEEYNGSAWSEVTDIGTSRKEMGSAGSQTAGVVYGGYNGSNLSATEEYDGSSWTAGGSLSTARRTYAGLGIQTAALAYGGYISGPGGTASNITEEYGGTSWTSGGNMNTGRYGHAGCGLQTAGLAFGGEISGPTYTNKSEEYDGTSWSEGNNMNNIITVPAGDGIQTDALVFTGYNTADLAITEGYDGTSWSTRPSLAQARRSGAGSHDGASGSGSSALAFGGAPVPSRGTATEEFTGETETANVTDFATS